MAVVADQRSFRDAVCQHFRCAPEAYGETVFSHCLYPHATWPARLIRRFIPDYFYSDFELIRLVANKTEAEELRTEVRLHRFEYPPETLLRRFLRVRLSGQRLLDLGDQLLSQQPVHTSPDPGSPGG
jgi:hypothetical protein